MRMAARSVMPMLLATSRIRARGFSPRQIRTCAWLLKKCHTELGSLMIRAPCALRFTRHFFHDIMYRLYGSTVEADLASKAKASCPNRTRAQSSSSIAVAENPRREEIRWQVELLEGAASRASPRQRSGNQMCWFGSTLGWPVGLQPERACCSCSCSVRRPDRAKVFELLKANRRSWMRNDPSTHLGSRVARNGP